MRILICFFIALLWAGYAQAFAPGFLPTATSSYTAGGTCDSTTDAVIAGVNSGTTNENNITATKFVSQAVSLTAGQVITGFSTMVQGTGYGTGYLFIELYTDSSGEPGTAVPNTRGAVAYNDISDSAREAEELLLAAAYTVVTTGTYHVVIGGTVGGTAYYGLYKGTTTNGDTHYTTDAGASWTLFGDDIRVEVLGCN